MYFKKLTSAHSNAWAKTVKGTNFKMRPPQNLFKMMIHTKEMNKVTERDIMSGKDTYSVQKEAVFHSTKEQYLNEIFK